MTKQLKLQEQQEAIKESSEFRTSADEKDGYITHTQACRVRNIGEEQIEMRNKREKESWQRMGKKSIERECECSREIVVEGKKPQNDSEEFRKTLGRKSPLSKEGKSCCCCCCFRLFCNYKGSG